VLNLSLVILGSIWVGGTLRQWHWAKMLYWHYRGEEGMITIDSSRKKTVLNMFYAASVIWAQNGLTPCCKSLEVLTHQGVKSSHTKTDESVNLQGLGLCFTTVSLLLAYSMYW